jgi:hypothetical protein
MGHEQLVRINEDLEIRERLAAARIRVRALVGLELLILHRPVERRFTAEERSRVSILSAGLTREHEEQIRAVIPGDDHRWERLPSPCVAGFRSCFFRPIAGRTVSRKLRPNALGDRSGGETQNEICAPESFSRGGSSNLLKAHPQKRRRARRLLQLNSERRAMVAPGASSSLVPVSKLPAQPPSVPPVAC